MQEHKDNASNSIRGIHPMMNLVRFIKDKLNLTVKLKPPDYALASSNAWWAFIAGSLVCNYAEQSLSQKNMLSRFICKFSVFFMCQLVHHLRVERKNQLPFPQNGFDLPNSCEDNNCKLSEMYWYTEWVPLKSIWPNPTYRLENFETAGDNLFEHTEIRLGTSLLLNDSVSGCRLSAGQDVCKLYFGSYGGQSTELVVEPGEYYAIGDQCKILRVKPISAVNYLSLKFVKHHFHPISKNWPTLQQISQRHEELAKTKAAMVQVFKEELIMKACNPKRLFQCLDIHDAAELNGLSATTI